MTDTDLFEHSTPELYDRYMGPLLFVPYAKHVAERVAPLRPGRILETAAGTGIVTRAVSEALPAADVAAIDINPAVVDFAGTRPLQLHGRHGGRTRPARRRRALQPWDGKNAPMSAHIATSVR